MANCIDFPDDFLDVEETELPAQSEIQLTQSTVSTPSNELESQSKQLNDYEFEQLSAPMASECVYEELTAFNSAQQIYQVPQQSARCSGFEQGPPPQPWIQPQPAESLFPVRIQGYTGSQQSSAPLPIRSIPRYGQIQRIQNMNHSGHHHSSASPSTGPLIVPAHHMRVAHARRPFQNITNMASTTSNTNQVDIPAKKERKRRVAKVSDCKKPMNSYFVFATKYRGKLALERPGMKREDMSKELSEIWKAMSDEEKEPYKQEASKLSEDYRNEKAHPKPKIAASLVQAKAKPSRPSPPKQMNVLSEADTRIMKILEELFTSEQANAAENEDSKLEPQLCQNALPQKEDAQEYNLDNIEPTYQNLPLQPLNNIVENPTEIVNENQPEQMPCLERYDLELQNSLENSNVGVISPKSSGPQPSSSSSTSPNSFSTASVSPNSSNVSSPPGPFLDFTNPQNQYYLNYMHNPFLPLPSINSFYPWV